MKHPPSNCPKCGSALVRAPTGGRPTRWCCEGCKRSGEDEMARLPSRLRTFKDGRAVDRLNGYPTEGRDEIIADLQKRYDHLAGVPATSLTHPHSG